MEWKKPRIKSMVWNIRKKDTQSVQQEEKRFQNIKDSVRSLKLFNIRLIGVPEREEKEQGIGNLFEKNNKGKLP